MLTRQHVTDQLLTLSFQRTAKWSNGALAVYNAFELIPCAIIIFFHLWRTAGSVMRAESYHGHWGTLLYRPESIPFLTWGLWLPSDPRSLIANAISALAHRVLPQVPRHKTLNGDRDGTGVPA